MKRLYIPFCFVILSCLLLCSRPVMASSYHPKEWELLRLTNKERMNAGLQPLSSTAALHEASKTRAKELDICFSHTRPNGQSSFSILKASKIPFQYVAENIAAGFSSPGKVLNAWLNSPPHKANILGNASYQHVGIGYYKSKWDQLFISGCKPKKISISSKKKITITQGQPLDSLGLTLTVKCNQHGTAELPLISEMTTGYHPNKVGTQKVTIHYYNLKTTITVKVVKKPISSCRISKIKKQRYTGKPIYPTVSIKDGSKKLVKNKDYLLHYKNNRKIGKATITITGKGTYTGKKLISFTIKK